MDQCNSFKLNSLWKAEKMNICHFKPLGAPRGEMLFASLQAKTLPSDSKFLILYAINLFGFVSRSIMARSRLGVQTQTHLTLSCFHCSATSQLCVQLTWNLPSPKLPVPLLFHSDYRSGGGGAEA